MSRFLDRLPTSITSLSLTSFYHSTSPTSAANRLLARVGPTLDSLHFHPYNDSVFPPHLEPALFEHFKDVRVFSFDAEEGFACLPALEKAEKITFGRPGVIPTAQTHVPRALVNDPSAVLPAPRNPQHAGSHKELQLLQLSFVKPSHRTDSSVLQLGRALADLGVDLLDGEGRRWDPKRVMDRSRLLRREGALWFEYDVPPEFAFVLHSLDED